MPLAFSGGDAGMEMGGENIPKNLEDKEASDNLIKKSDLCLR